VTAVFCTISTPSHLHQATTCLLSIREHHPGARCVLLLVHGAGDPPGLPGEIEVMRPEHCIPADALKQMQDNYTVAELCFAAKPFLMCALLTPEVGQVHYFDGDCLVLSSTDPLCAELDNADLLLTPHSLTPIPDDGATPRPLAILRAGAFNAGYMGVRHTEQGLFFVNWLSAMTLKYAKNQPKAGMCGDQKWLDLVPVLFRGLAICRHWGANVAYWNLHERSLSLDDRGYFRVNGQALIFFHFSGYDPVQPLQLSKYQNRTRLVPGSALHELVRNYDNRTMAAAGNFAGRGVTASRLFRFLRR